MDAHDLKEMEIVKMIYDMYEDGMSQPTIAIELYEKGVRNPRYKEPQLIQLGHVAHILNNKCYTGELVEEKVVTVKDRRAVETKTCVEKVTLIIRVVERTGNSQ